MCVPHETVWHVGNDDPVFLRGTHAEVCMLLYSPDDNSSRILFITILSRNHEDTVDVVTTIPGLYNNLRCENDVVA